MNDLISAGAGWDDLTRELDAWATAGRQADFWWRDDDAVAATPALDQLLALSRRHAAPVMLAVIPAFAEVALAARLATERLATPVQHGWAHANHAAPGRAKSELGPERPPSQVLGELGRGALALDRTLGAAWLRVLVPPNNRIAPAVAAGLKGAGYLGLSADKPRRAAPHGLNQVNVHVDIMNWAGKTFLGERACLALACVHLADRRTGRIDAAEPTGLLTHHLVHDRPAWVFVEAFLAAIAAHPASRWRAARELFAAAASARAA